MSRVLRLEAVVAGYGGHEVLRGISLVVNPGEIVALVGPNGAGKSTVLKVASGVLSPDAGRVCLGSRDITGVAAHQRVHSGVSYCIQGARVFASLTVAENLTIGAHGLAGAAKEEAVARVLELFPGLEPLRGREARLLSGGERQALAMAMALVRRPAFLLLDEPSVGLSPALVRAALERIVEISGSWETGVLLVEQNLEEALGIADRAVALAGGRVAMETTEPHAWLSSAELEKVFLGAETDVQPLDF